MKKRRENASLASSSCFLSFSFVHVSPLPCPPPPQQLFSTTIIIIRTCRERRKTKNRKQTKN